MKQPNLKPSGLTRGLVWGGTALLGLSGLALVPAEWLGADHAPWAWEGSRVIVALHGGLALFFCGLVGAMLPHVRAGLAAGRNRAWGLALLLALGLLLVSAWALYYGPAEWQDWTGRMHFAAGALLPGLIALHAWKGRRR